MKALKLLSLLFLMTILSISCSKDDFVSNPLQEADNFVEDNPYFNYTIGEGPFVYFDDLIFKEILLINSDININEDNEISFEEATSYNGAIDVSFNNIESLTGIEKFTNIIALNCENNNIDTLNFNNNLNLKYLNCGNNPFYEINLTQNNKLKNLDIRTTNISTLDLSENVDLVAIRGMCNSNLKTVNLRNNNNAKILVFFFNHNNTNLECVQVDDINYSNSATNWSISTNAEYSLNCFDISE